jgi:hypothetical protein
MDLSAPVSHILQKLSVQDWGLLQSLVSFSDFLSSSDPKFSNLANAVAGQEK